jgi:hypothetical protein
MSLPGTMTDAVVCNPNIPNIQGRLMLRTYRQWIIIKLEFCGLDQLSFTKHFSPQCICHHFSCINNLQLSFACTNQAIVYPNWATMFSLPYVSASASRYSVNSSFYVLTCQTAFNIQAHRSESPCPNMLPSHIQYTSPYTAVCFNVYSLPTECKI